MKSNISTHFGKDRGEDEKALLKTHYPEYPEANEISSTASAAGGNQSLLFLCKSADRI